VIALPTPALKSPGVVSKSRWYANNGSVFVARAPKPRTDESVTRRRI
jgi:hypothetical protein